MKDKIVDAYFKLREKYYSYDNLHTFKDNMQVVITMTPKAYFKLRAEANEMVNYINTDFIIDVNFINLCGEKTPVIIDNTLPNNVEFVIQYRKDYERLEKEKLMEKFIKMFG